MAIARKNTGISDLADLKAQAEKAPAVFRPVWNVEKNYVTGFILRPQAVDAHQGAETEAATSMALLARAAVTALEGLQAGRKAVLIVPVTFSTLHAYPYRGNFLALLRRLPRKARTLIVLQVTAIPAHAPKQRLQSVQADIAPLCRALVLTSDLAGANLDCVPREGVHACAIDLDRQSCGDFERESLMSWFADKARGIDCRALADGVATTAQLCAAVAAGFRYIAGPAIGPDRAEASAISPFALASAYGR